MRLKMAEQSEGLYYFPIINKKHTETVGSWASAFSGSALCCNRADNDGSVSSAVFADSKLGNGSSSSLTQKYRLNLVYFSPYMMGDS